MNIVKLAQRADLALGLILLVYSGYELFAGRYLAAGLGFLAATLSLASAKFVPSRWLVRKLMVAHLK